MEEKKVFELEFGTRKITVEIGELAKQANAACLVRYNDTVILSACVMSANATSADFFPLTINYQEKFYSVGKIPGGFIKREGRPTEQAILAARLIDRPIRPLFKEGFRNEVQVINTVLSVEQDCTPEMTALFGSSLCLSISDIPFEGPVAGVVVGHVKDKFIINPSVEELEQSDINLSVAGTKEAINMVESGSKEVSEELMIEAIMFGHEAIKKLVEFQEKIVKEVGKPKIEVTLAKLDEDLVHEVNEFAKEKMCKAIQIKDKLEKYAAIDQVKEDSVTYFQEKYQEKEELDKILADVKKVVDNIEAEEVRRLITEEHIRPDGRAMDEIRPLSARIDILPRTHGSGLFTRGQTQVLSTTTLGALGEHQILDGLGIEEEKRFMHHYNFPSFSVGETGRYGAPGRREIGHGALGERALSQVIPSEEEFPYTIRVVSEVLESNGSSSQASICAGCLSLMAAGVPIKAPVAGIAMGLITKGDKYTILTDIQGLEDFFGDMDFKVAGTKNGITAIQVDIKVEGLSYEIIEEAFARTHKARNYILDEVMLKQIAEPRSNISRYAPKIINFKINPEKIKDVIGSGGKTINKIIAETGVKIDIEEDGTVFIYAQESENAKKAQEIIDGIARDIEVGGIYLGTVTRIMNFGAFVDIGGGKEGLLHISKISKERVEKVEDVLKVGDKITVKVYEIDHQGRVNLTRKDLEEPKTEEE